MSGYFSQSILLDHQFTLGEQFITVWERTSPSKARRHFIFLHGRFGNSETWKALIQQIPRIHRCWSVDFPGFGQSFTVSELQPTLLDYVALIEKLMVRLVDSSCAVVLVGHDVGAMIAKLIVARGVRPIEALVLLSPISLEDVGEKLYPGIQGWKARWHLKRLLESADRIPSSYRSLLIEPWKRKASRRSLVSAFQSLWESWPDHHERAQWLEKIKSLRIPALVLRGSKDELSSRESGVELARIMPEAMYFEEPHCGHWPHLENPEWVASKMEELVFRLDELAPFQEAN